MDLAKFVFEMGASVGVITPFTVAVVKGSEKFGAAGKVQLAIALIFGGALGAFASLAVNGVPSDLMQAFQMTLYVLASAGAPVGFYEALKAPKE